MTQPRRLEGDDNIVHGVSRHYHARTWCGLARVQLGRMQFVKTSQPLTCFVCIGLEGPGDEEVDA